MKKIVLFMGGVITLALTTSCSEDFAGIDEQNTTNQIENNNMVYTHTNPAGPAPYNSP